MTTYAIRISLLLVLLNPAAGIAPPQPAAGSPVPVSARTFPAPAARAVVVPVPAFRWPLDGVPRLVRRFDPPPQPWAPGHRGVDLAAGPGAVVRAAGGGVVLFAGRIAGRGVVSVSHSNGLRTTYEPVEPRVATNQRLSAGHPLGLLVAGHPGCPAATCLHWGLRRGEEYVDPLALLGLGRVRLLPVQVSLARTAGSRRARLSYSSARL